MVTLATDCCLVQPQQHIDGAARQRWTYKSLRVNSLSTWRAEVFDVCMTSRWFLRHAAPWDIPRSSQRRQLLVRRAWNAVVGVNVVVDVAVWIRRCCPSPNCCCEPPCCDFQLKETEVCCTHCSRIEALVCWRVMVLQNFVWNCRYTVGSIIWTLKRAVQPPGHQYKLYKNCLILGQEQHFSANVL